MRRHFLLTRAADRQNALGTFLSQQGFALTLYPLLMPEHLPLSAADARTLGQASDFIITSRRALLGFAGEKKPLWCVGAPPPDWPVAGTAESAGALKQLLAEKLSRAATPVYLRGLDISAPLDVPNLQEVITYAMRETAPAAPAPNDYWGAAVFSKRSAKLLSARCSAAAIKNVFCLSPAIAENITIPQAISHAANSPSLLSLIQCIEKHLQCG